MKMFALTCTTALLTLSASACTHYGGPVVHKDGILLGKTQTALFFTTHTMLDCKEKRDKDNYIKQLNCRKVEINDGAYGDLDAPQRKYRLGDGEDLDSSTSGDLDEGIDEEDQ